MDTWQGEFGWQTHALTGRPDLLNYIRTEQLSWPSLWEFYNTRGLPPPDALARCMSLFHQYLAWQMELEAGIDGDTSPSLGELMAWARFCVHATEQMPDRMIQEQLLALVEAGALSLTYYERAYHSYLRALVEKYSAEWARDLQAPDRLDEIQPCEEFGLLPVFVPEDASEGDLAGDKEWQRFKRALAQRQHDSWCGAYASLMSSLDDLLDTRPGL